MTSTVIYEGNLRTVATHQASGNEIETDAPIDNQGRGESFSPTDLVATALGSCMLTIMGMKARDMGIALDGTTIEVQKIMKADPRRIGGIQIRYHFSEHLTLTDKDKKILERAADTCPVKYSLHPDIEVEVKYNWEPVTI